ncbi:MAG: VOC family protein [Planctomycetota bacterium]
MFDDQVPSGHFVWHTIASPARDATTEFFKSVFGWVSWELEIVGVGHYRVLRNGDRDVAGAVEVDEDGPASWISYVTVDDVDEAVKRGNELGGQTMIPAVSVPMMGRYAILSAPDGSVIAPVNLSTEAMTPPPIGQPPRTHAFCWADLESRDPEKAAPFYASLFGWDFDESNGLFENRGEAVASLSNGSGETSLWRAFVTVENLAESSERIASADGQVERGTSAGALGDDAAIAVEPSGLSFGIVKPA